MKSKTKTIIIIISIIVILAIIGFVLFLLFRPSSEMVIPTDNFRWGCDPNEYNCDDFETQKQAQAVFESCGGRGHDIHGLDRDGNGIACEGLK